MIDESLKLKKILCAKNGKYGLKKDGHRSWAVKPIYDEIGSGCFINHYIGIKRDGKFGTLDLKTMEEYIPCIYGFPLYWNKNGLAIAWKNKKAGVVNFQNELVVPCIYDNLYFLRKSDGLFAELGKEKLKLDFEGKKVDFSKDDMELVNRRVLDEYPEEDKMTIEELESLIIGLYGQYKHSLSDDLKTRIDKLLFVRRLKMNESWEHTPENVEAISRVNDLLMKAVRKAMGLGYKTAKSLEWMSKINNEDYEVEVGVFPYWQNRKSEYCYKPTLSISKEKELLFKDELEMSDKHIWNIIVEMGETSFSVNGQNVCFSHASRTADLKDWDYKQATLDDGQTWDEGIHLPAYQDVYFLYPWHLLYWDNFSFSFYDLANINDFRVIISVKFEQKFRDNKQ